MGMSSRLTVEFYPSELEPPCRHPSYFVGLLLQGAKLPYSNYGHVVLAKPSPILFYPISSVEVSTSGV